MSTSKRIRTINNQIDIIKQAEIEELARVGREIERHLDKMAKAWINSFWFVNKKALEMNGISKEDLDFTQTEFWKSEIKQHYSDESFNLMIRDKMTLTDLLAKKIPTKFKKDNSPSNV